MAGMPLRAKILARIEADGGWDEAVFDRVRAGDYMKDIAKDLGATYSILRDAIRHGGEERKREYETAKFESADALVEDAMIAIDKLDDIIAITSPEVSRAKLTADTKRWLAGRRDRGQYGDDPLAVIGVLDLGQLHLSALQKAGSRDLLEAPEPEAIEADFTLEERQSDEGDSDSTPDSDFGSM